MGLNILAADHQHFCFCPVSPTATEENPVCQEDSPESIHRTIAHNRVLHSCTVWRDQPIKQLTHHRHSHVDSPAYKQPAVDSGLLTQGCRQVAVNTTSRWEIKQLGVSFGSIFLLLSFESGWESPLYDNPVMGSEVCMSLVWISKAAISHIEESEVMLLSVFYYCICDFLCHCHSFNPSPCCCNHFTVSMPCDVSCQDFRVA